MSLESTAKRRAEFGSAGTCRLAERALVGELSALERQQLADTLEQHAEDRQAYDVLARAMCALEGGGDLAQGQHERILAAALGAAAAPELRAEAATRGARLLGARWLGAIGLAVAAAAALLLLLWRRDAPTTPPRGMQTRGAASASGAEGSGARAHGAGKYGLEVHCVRAGQVRDMPKRSVKDSVDARCGSRDHLQLSLTHLAPPSGRRYPYLLVVGLGRDGDAGAKGRARQLFYYPAPPTGRSGAARDGSDAEPLGQAVRLEVNHRAGRVRIVAVFSTEPLEASRVHAWLSGLTWQQRAGDKSRALGRGVVVIERRMSILSPAAPSEPTQPSRGTAAPREKTR